MLICPLCNGLKKPYLYCPLCGNAMEDGGLLQSYDEPYSPYLGEDILCQLNHYPPDLCLHLFSCPSCHYDQRKFIKKVTP